MKGLRKYVSPFAPDHSGAVSALYSLGGILVVCDAGGCAGNICGFDEPRWFDTKSAIFSAGLRDMDAILGRDERMVAKLADCAARVDAKFAAIIGTPVPSVIGTDYKALKRMTQKKVDLPIFTVDTNGFDLYDEGVEKAFCALFETFSQDVLPVKKGAIGVIGMTPLDCSSSQEAKLLCMWLNDKGYGDVRIYGMDASFEDVFRASEVEKNIVVSSAGLKAAKVLQERFGTPYACVDPLVDAFLPNDVDWEGKKVLVLHQQVRAKAVQVLLKERGADVLAGSWFMQPGEITAQSDLSFSEEDELQVVLEEGNYDYLIADSSFWPLAPKDSKIALIDLPHFAVSGRWLDL